MENNGVVTPPVDPEVVVPAAPAAPQLDNSRPSQLATRMGSIGSIHPFDVSRPDQWGKYLLYMNLYFRANQLLNVPDDVQRDIFLSLAGTDVFGIVTSFVLERPYDELTRQEIADLLTVQFTPSDSVLINSFKFGNEGAKTDGIGCRVRSGAERVG